MNKIETLYNNFLNKKSLYYSYIRSYIIFFSEKENKNIENLNNNNYEKNLFLSKNNFLLKKNSIKNFFLYKIYNNLNIPYIINYNSSRKNAILEIKKNKKDEIFIINNNKKTTYISNKTIKINKNININDIYLLNDIDQKILIIETYINANIKHKIKYNAILITNNNTKNVFLNFYIKQKNKSNLNFKTISFNNSANINYYCFLIGKKTFLKKKIFLNINIFNNNKLYLNIYHYNNNSKSISKLGAIIKNEGQINFNGNINVGNDIKNIIAHLKCDGITLTNNGTIEFNPNMFINNNDVVCTHGANIGSIDQNIINYMLTRGIDKKNCKKILMKTFKKKFINKKINSIIKKYNG